MSVNMEAAPEARVVRSWMEYANDRDALVTMMYEMVWTQDDVPVKHGYKAVRFLRIVMLPKTDKYQLQFMEMMSQLLSGMYGQSIDWIVMLVNILYPKALGLYHLYGVQAVADTPEEAKKKANADYAALSALLQGTFRTMQFQPLTREEASWVQHKLFNMKKVFALRGIPQARRSAAESQQIGWGQEESPTAEGTTESFVAGLSGREYCLMVLGSAISDRVLNQWRTQMAKEMTHWNGLKEGVRSVSAGVSIPFLFGANLGASSGVTHQLGHNTGTSHTLAEGHSLTTTSTQGVSHTVSHSSSVSHGVSSSQSLGESHGVSSSQGLSASQSLGRSQNVSVGSGHSASQSIGVNHSDSASTSQSVSHNATLGSTQGETQGATFTKGETSSTSQGISQGMTNTQSLSHGTSSTQTIGNTVGQTVGHTKGNTYGSSDSFGYGASSGTSQGNSSGTTVGSGHTLSTANGQSQTTSSGTSQGLNVGADMVVKAGGSYGQTQTNGHGLTHTTTDAQNVTTSQNEGLSHSVTNSHNTSTGWGHSMSQSQSLSQSDSASASRSSAIGSTASVGQSQAVSNQKSLSNSFGTTDSLGQSQSTSNSISQSQGIGSSQGIGTSTMNGSSAGSSVGSNQSISQGFGASAGSSLGKSDSVGSTLGTSQGASQGTSSGTSQGVSSSQGTTDSQGLSRGASSTASEGTSQGQSTSQGSSQGLSQGLSASTGIGPSVSFGKSYKWLDQEVVQITSLLEYQNNRLMLALSGQGAFFVDTWVATPDEESDAAAKALARTTWINEGALVNPLEVIPEEEPEHLLYHMASFSPCQRKESAGHMQSYHYTTVLLANEATAYTHPIRMSEGGMYADVEGMPILSVPANRHGPINMGKVMSAERWTPSMGYLTPFDFRINLDELHHGLWAAGSRSGKTEAALRFAVELSQARWKKADDRRFRIISMDPKTDWRRLSLFVDPERYRFYSLYNDALHPITLNLCKIPKGVDPEIYINALVEAFCRAFQLNERSREILWEAMFALYQRANVIGPDWPLFAAERSNEVSMTALYAYIHNKKDDLDAQRGASNADKESYGRVLQRLGPFGMPSSKESRFFGQPNTMGIDDLLLEPKSDDVINLESAGMEPMFRNFVFGLISASIFHYGSAHEGGYFAPDQVPTILFIEEANEVLSGQLNTQGGGGIGLPGISQFEKMIDQCAGWGLFVHAITQQPQFMPSSILANAGMLFVGNLSQEEDITKIIIKLGRDPKRQNIDLFRWIPRIPVGQMIIRSARNSDFKALEPSHVAIARLPMYPEKLGESMPTNSQLMLILEKAEMERSLKRLDT